MKKIVTPEEKEKKNRRNRTIIGIILAVILILSTAGYAIINMGNSSVQNPAVKYNNYQFTRTSDVWTTQISGYTFYFHYLPNETLGQTSKTINDYTKKTLYLAQDSIENYEITRNLGYFIDRAQVACLDSDNCTSDLPVKNCSDNIIIIKQEGFNKISEDNNCVYIFENESYKEIDAFLFKILGIN